MREAILRGISDPRYLSRNVLRLHVCHLRSSDGAADPYAVGSPRRDGQQPLPGAADEDWWAGFLHGSWPPLQPGDGVVLPREADRLVPKQLCHYVQGLVQAIDARAGGVEGQAGLGIV